MSFKQLFFCYAVCFMVGAISSPLWAQDGHKTVHHYNLDSISIDSLDHLLLQEELTEEKSRSLEDVVVVAYGRSRKRDLTGAITSIKSSEIENLPATNVLSALEGTTGVMIQNSNGQVGSEGYTFIRGFASANGSNAPLYVVDGAEYHGSLNDINPEDIESVSILKDASALALYGSRAANGVIMITLKTGKKDSKQKNDNEKLDFRFSVKQGIYTRGMPEYSRLGANQWMEMQFQGLVNSQVTGGMSREAAIAGAQQNLVTDYMRYNIYNKPATQLFDANGKLVAGAAILPAYASDRDWEGALLQTGVRQEYDISASFSNDKSHGYFSFGYLDESGYIKQSDFKRFTGRLNFSYHPTKFFDVGMSLDFSDQTSHTMRQSADNAGNIISFMRNVAPIYPIHQHDSTTGEILLDSKGQPLYDDSENRPFKSRRNPVWELDDIHNNYNRVTVQARPYLEINFPFNIKFRAHYVRNLINQKNRDTYGTNVGDWAGIGLTQHTDVWQRNWMTDQQFLWTYKIGRHNFDFFVGHESQQRTYITETVSAYQELQEDNDEFINYAAMHGINGYTTKQRTESYLGRFHWNYLHRYYAEFCFRRDGSSRFSSEGRWGNFWSLGGSYVMSDENWFQTAAIGGVVSDLKLRINYGEIGNDRSASLYAYENLYQITSIASSSGVYSSQRGNSKLKWETVATFNTGLDIKLWNRWQTTVDFYIKNSRDLIFDSPLALSAGLTSTTVRDASPTYTINMGSVRNTGIEIQTDVDAFRNKDWRLNVGLGFARNVNEVTNMPATSRETGIIKANGQLIAIGKSLYTWYLPEYCGVNSANGHALYSFDDASYYVKGSHMATQDRIGLDPSVETSLVEINGTWYTDDLNCSYVRRVTRGSVIPSFFGNITTKVSYKRLSCMWLCNYSVGGKIYDGSYMGLMSASGTSQCALHTDILNSWTYDKATPEPTLTRDYNPAIDYSRSSANNGRSTRFLTRGDYFTIRRLQVSYSLSKKALKVIHAKDLTLSFTGENLLTLTARKGMNPSQGASSTGLGGVTSDVSSTLRNLSLGLNIKM